MSIINLITRNDARHNTIYLHLLSNKLFTTKVCYRWDLNIINRLCEAIWVNKVYWRLLCRSYAKYYFNKWVIINSKILTSRTMEGTKWVSSPVNTNSSNRAHSCIGLKVGAAISTAVAKCILTGHVVGEWVNETVASSKCFVLEQLFAVLVSRWLVLTFVVAPLGWAWAVLLIQIKWCREFLYEPAFTKFLYILCQLKNTYVSV